jgi:electron transfer flavoprotein beta subunit
MNIAVIAKMVPDLVEELSIDSSGTKLDTSFARFIVNEPDDHAIEEAILLKEKAGGTVTVVGFDDDGTDDVLYTAAAKGADRLIKLQGISAAETSNHGLAQACVEVMTALKPDLILTGVQAHNDLDGSLGSLLSEMLGMPYVGYISGIEGKDGTISIRKEYPGGLVGKMDGPLPVVLGIQAAEQAPRYVAVSKVRQAMKSSSLEEQAATAPSNGAATIRRMYKSEAAQHASMITGSPEEIAAQLADIFKELGVL